jgi:hypothetical protein
MELYPPTNGISVTLILQFTLGKCVVLLSSIIADSMDADMIGLLSECSKLKERCMVELIYNSWNEFSKSY